MLLNADFVPQVFRSSKIKVRKEDKSGVLKVGGQTWFMQTPSGEEAEEG